mmetsp:Transcript_122605/g.358058  ORF Transcript_122605/g.358058 Transcript_122605/m.358058 type:complete len:441 (-) Transcript_122605:170-1492(-)
MPRRLAFPWLLCAASAAGAPASSAGADASPVSPPPPTPSRGCQAKQSLPTGQPLKMTMPLEDPALFNRFRDYYLYLPGKFANDKPLPVFFMFHGFYNTAQHLQTMNALMYMANQTGDFIVVHPQAMEDCGKPNCEEMGAWNAGGTSQSPGPMGPTCDQDRSTFGHYPCYTSCQSGPGSLAPQGCRDKCSSSSCVNDTLFFEALLDHVEDTLCVDRRRMHVGGMSVGGVMAYSMLSKFAGRLASGLPVAGSALLGFWHPPQHPIALMDIHGYMDNTIPANLSNGFRWPHRKAPHGGVFSNDGFYYTPNIELTSSVAAANGCAGGPLPWPTPQDGSAEWHCLQPHGACASGQPVVRCVWNGNHMLPFRGPGINKDLKRWYKMHVFGRIAWQWFKDRSLAQEPPPRRSEHAVHMATLSQVLPMPDDWETHVSDESEEGDEIIV